MVDNPHGVEFDKFLSTDIYVHKYLFRNMDIFLDLFEDMNIENVYSRRVHKYYGLYNIEHNFCFGTDVFSGEKDKGVTTRMIDFSKDWYLSSWSFDGPYTIISDISIDKKTAGDYGGESKKCEVLWVKVDRRKLDDYCLNIKSSPSQLLHKYESRIKTSLSGRPDINVKSLLYENMNGYMFTYCIY